MVTTRIGILGDGIQVDDADVPGAADANDCKQFTAAARWRRQADPAMIRRAAYTPVR
jgi:hypothetical protein